MQKLYCYIDESGQDTEGKLFIVSAVIVQSERDAIIALLEHIEQQTGKGRLKWAKSKDTQRAAYIRAVLQIPVFRGKLHYAVYADTLEYIECTAAAAAEAIIYHVEEEKYKADVLLDGLRDSERNTFAANLRDRGIRTGKVKGVDDEQDTLIRLADAVCGFLRDALEERAEFARMMAKAVREGYLIQVGE